MKETIRSCLLFSAYITKFRPRAGRVVVGCHGDGMPSRDDGLRRCILSDPATEVELSAQNPGKLQNGILLKIILVCNCFSLNLSLFATGCNCHEESYRASVGCCLRFA